MNTYDRPLVGFSIVNYHSEALVGDLLTSLRDALPVGSYRVCIADNSCSGFALRAVIESAQISDIVHVVDCEGNLGYAGGNNRAVDFLVSNFDVPAICVVNPDIRVVKIDLLQVEQLISPGSPVVLCAVTEEPGREPRPGVAKISWLTGSVIKNGSRSLFGTLSFAYGNFFVVSSANWSRLGGLNDDFFLYFEEPDLSIRASSIGEPVGVLTHTFVQHSRGGTVGGPAGTSDIQLFHTARSAVIFYRVHRRYFLPVVIGVRLYHACALFGKGMHHEARVLVKGLKEGLTAKIAASKSTS